MRRAVASLAVSGRVALVGLTVGLALMATSASQAATPSASQAVGATNGLALAMLARLAPGENVVASPFSVETALAMVAQGASGQTAAQLDDALGGVASPGVLAASNRALAAALHTSVSSYGAGGPELNSANNLWLQSGRRLDAAFGATLTRDFGATPQQADFGSDPSGAVQTINDWVSAQTHGLIPALMSPADVTPATELVLANAVYLHADWQTPFNANLTATGTFHGLGGDVSVPFMSEGSDGARAYPYAATGRYRAVALPYAHSSLQFVAVMPPAGQISGFSRWLTEARLNALMASLHSRMLDLELPKFSLSTKLSLVGFLNGLGVTRAFSAASQLNRIVSGAPVAIQAIVHDATLKVAEKGTVAAAATGVSLAPTVAAPAATQLVLNRPFLVFLRDARTGAILFAARVVDPSED